MKIGYNTITLSVEDREAFASTCKAEYLRRYFRFCSAFAGIKLGVIYYAAKTEGNNHERSLSITTDEFEPSIERKAVAI